MRLRCILTLLILLAGAVSGLADSPPASGSWITNFAFEPYLTYAPAQASTPRPEFGGGILVIYNMSKYAGVAVGGDYLGQFSLVSGNVSLKYPVAVGKVTVIPFLMGGFGYAMSGAERRISTISDAGVYARCGTLMSGNFNIGLCAGKWNNAGDYSGVRYHFFAGWSKGF